MFDINSDFIFAKDMGCVNNDVYHGWVKFVTEYFYAATVLHQCHNLWVTEMSAGTLLAILYA
jgi:hypothetical protein